MNIFNKVTLQSLKKNRTRTIVTIIGIMLSAAMICAVTTFVSSMQNYVLQYAVYNNGDWHGAVYDADFKSYVEIRRSEEVSASAYGQLLGYAKIESNNEYKPYLYVIGGEKDRFFETLPIHLISGRLPASSHEIILPEHLTSDGGLTYKLGDSITLELGDRMLDGWKLNQNNPCYEYNSEINEDVPNGETIEVRESRTYTVVGFYKRPEFEDYSAPGFTALTVADEEISNDTHFDVYFKMVNVADVYNFIGEKGLTGTYNTDVLLYSGVSRYDSFLRMLLGLAAIVIGLIMFGSVSLIYNAFSISVSERTKQFGLLSSIGATKKQLKKMVLFEAITVSAVGIPLGIAVGIGGIGLTLLIIGNRFAGMIGNGFEEPMQICVSWEAVAIAVVVAFITVLISAWIPSKRVTRVSAVEAIRQSMDIKTKNKPVKTSKLTYKLFGLSGVLASKHYKRDRKKYRTTVISLFMSVVLFVSASAFTDYLMESVTGGLSTEYYDLVYLADSEESMNGKTCDEFLELMMSDEDVTDGAYAYRGYFSGTISNRYLTDEFVESSMQLAASADYTVGADENETTISGYIYFVNDSEFKKLLKEYGLKETDYYNADRPLGIALDNNIQFDEFQQRFVTVDALEGNASEIVCSVLKESIDGYKYSGTVFEDNGEPFLQYQSSTDESDKLELTYEEAHLRFRICSGKTITDIPYYVTKSEPAHLKMIYPMSMVDCVLPEDDNVRNGFSCEYYLLTQNHSASYENLKSILTENGFDYTKILDYAAEAEMSRNIIIIIQVFTYGFIILISLIAAANVFNTISTNISLRRREFAMLKSVGMTQKGFNRMMNYECLLYGSKALMLGLPVSGGVTYLIYLAFKEGYETDFHLPWVAIGVAVFSVFAVVFATMLYSMNRIKNENPIDALKNENI